MVRNVQSKSHRLRNILGSQRLLNSGINTVSRLFRTQTVQGELFGVHHARANLNHAHIMLCLFQAQRLRQAASAELRRIVPGTALVAVFRGGRGQVQDCAVTVQSQRLREGAHHVQNAEHVHLVHLQVVDRLTLRNLIHANSATGNINQGINGALLLENLLGNEAHGMLVSHVAGHRVCTRLCVEGVEAVSAASQSIDGPAACHQMLYGGSTNTAGCAGHHGNFTNTGVGQERRCGDVGVLSHTLILVE